VILETWYKLVIVAWMGCGLEMHFKKVLTCMYQQVCVLSRVVCIGKKVERVEGLDALI
jgi:hypothetical protein